MVKVKLDLDALGIPADASDEHVAAALLARVETTIDDFRGAELTTSPDPRFGYSAERLLPLAQEINDLVVAWREVVVRIVAAHKKRAAEIEVENAAIRAAEKERRRQAEEDALVEPEPAEAPTADVDDGLITVQLMSARKSFREAKEQMNG